jgi:putative peptide zinc metalloprotease protein
MATLAQSLVSSSSRKLPIRKRPDLRARKHRYQGRLYWVVKDPVGLQYYRFEEEEFAILQMLDGELRQTIRTEELQQFIGMLHRSGLVITNAPGQGQQLAKRHDERKRKERLSTLTNVLSMRFKGLDPERFFNFIYPYIRWFFTVPAMVCCILLGLAALTLVLVQFDTFQARLPTFQSFFQAQNWMPLAITLAATKILHELGHGLSCKHFGGECHEIGVMFLVMTPCLYCNVSDSWMLPNRWHRAAIGAAGMYVEVVLASICTFIWWFTEPGPLNWFCLNVMFISSVSTVMFNANPLLRYDGYYILSDILEIPNLRQKASTILNRKLGKWFLGLEEPEDPFLPKRKQWLFAVYTVASAVYRWVVTLSILYFLNKVFEPYGLKILGQIIALGALYGLLIQPLWKVYKFFKVPGRLGKVKRTRMYVSLALLIAVIAGVLFIPLPAHVYCPLEVEAREAESVYVFVDGVLDEVFVRPGDAVEKGQPIAQLHNIDVDISIVDLTGKQETYEAQLAGLNAISFQDRTALAQVEPITKALLSVKKQRDKAEDDRGKLRLVAPISGTVLPPPLVEKQVDESTHLPPWYGSPFDKENIGATLVAGTMFCQIGEPNRLQARLIIDQNDDALVWPDQKVEIMLDQSAEFVYKSRILERGSETVKQTPVHLSSLSGGPVPTQMSPDGVGRPLTPAFDALVPLPFEDPHGLLRVGLVGRAKITTKPRTLWDRLYRYAARTFNFEL